MSDPNCWRCQGRGTFEDHDPMGYDIVRCDCSAPATQPDPKDARIAELEAELKCHRLTESHDMNNLREELGAARAECERQKQAERPLRTSYIRMLQSANQRLEAAAGRMREALQFYASGKHEPSLCESGCDGGTSISGGEDGSIARDALAQWDEAYSPKVRADSRTIGPVSIPVREDESAKSVEPGESGGILPCGKGGVK